MPYDDIDEDALNFSASSSQLNSEQKKCWQKALQCLARREHSTHELHTKLLKDFPQDVVNTCIHTLHSKDYLNDDRFLAYLKAKYPNHGAIKWRFEARKHQLEERLMQLNEDALQNTYQTNIPVPTEYDKAHMAFIKKFHPCDSTDMRTPKTLAKMMRFLLQRGFTYAVVQQVMKNYEESDVYIEHNQNI